jgi:hypothetical protein
MKKDLKYLLCVVLVAVLVNLVVPLIVAQLANAQQKAGPMSSLNALDQFVYLGVVDNSAPLVSSISVFVLVGVSVLIARAIC